VSNTRGRRRASQKVSRIESQGFENPPPQLLAQGDTSRLLDDQPQRDTSLGHSRLRALKGVVTRPCPGGAPPAGLLATPDAASATTANASAALDHVLRISPLPSR
jgi:hypothetical protein